MIIKKADIVATAVKKNQYPSDDVPEIAFVGRSNVGKSSLLNLLTNRKSLARVSQSPGKTRTINFYSVNDTFRIVDLPGYGYAKVSKSVTDDWDRMMDEYFKGRTNLKAVVQLVDSRIEPTKLDVAMYEYLKGLGLDGIVVMTKCDKLSKNELNKNRSVVKKTLGLDENAVIIPVSALKKTGHDRLLEVFDNVLDN
ncbi:MAG: ribosome biogenesis GTP-binding protein YihA/YsxC [Clostridia bacterium]|nr:ribosome biogenesis GTP-binding protein YihA/YsxC [Clostridia bacterium]